MSIFRATSRLKTMLIERMERSAPPAKVAGIIFRPSITPGEAEAVVRFNDGTHQLVVCGRGRVLNIARDLTNIAAAGFNRR